MRIVFDFSKNEVTQAAALTTEQGQALFEMVTDSLVPFIFAAGQNYVYKGDSTFGAGCLKLSTASANGIFVLRFPSLFVKSIDVTFHGWTNAAGTLTINGVTRQTPAGETLTLNFTLKELAREIEVSASNRVLITEIAIESATETTKEWQTLGTNSDAKAVLESELGDGGLIISSIAQDIEEKFAEWTFPYNYIKSPEKWRQSVRAWIKRNPKLNLLENLFSNGVGGADDGVFIEQWSGEDTKSIIKTPVKVSRTFTDTLGKKTRTMFRGVGSTGSGSLADEIIDEPLDGKNTQSEDTTTTYTGTDIDRMIRGTKRTYSDGRTVLERIESIEAARDPIYNFINGFSLLLVEPCEDWRNCYE